MSEASLHRTKRYTLKTIAKAQALLDTDAYRGNHGFKGKQLVAWKKMRVKYLVALRLVVAHKSVANVDEATCPLEAVNQWLWKVKPRNAERGHTPHSGCAFGGYVVNNPAWSSGTPAGYRWSFNVWNLIGSVDGEAEEATEYADEIAEAENNAVSLVAAFKKRYG